MPSLLTPQDVFDAVRQSDDRLDPSREARQDAYQEYAGRYGYKDDKVRRPVNLIAKAVNTFVPYLASRSPTHAVSTENLAVRGEAKKLSLALDVVSRKLRRMKISRQVILDSFLSPKGIVRCGTRAGADIYLTSGKTINPGQPYIMRVDWDDWIFDPAARCRDEALFEGHYYRLPRTDALESGVFEGMEHVIESLPAIGDGRCGFRRTSRHEDLSRQGDSGDYDMIDLIELMDLVFYDDDQPVKVTLPASEDYCDDFLRVVPLDAPDVGPYYDLEFYPIPNQPYGIPPVAWWRENAEHFQTLLNKAVDEIMKSRQVLVHKRDADEDAETIRDAEDSEILGVDDPEGVKNLQLGGVLPDLMPMSTLFMSWFDYSANNPSLLAGDKGGTDKVGIYEGQQAGAMQIVNDYQLLHEMFEEEVSRDLGWRLLNDPFIQLPLTKRIPGGEFVELQFNPAQMSGDFEDFNFKLKPRSMQLQNQDLRARRLVELLGVLGQAAEIQMATQGAYNATKVAQIVGNEFDIDEIDEIILDPAYAMQLQALYAGAAQPQGPGQPAGMVKPGAGGVGFQGGGTSNKQTTPGGARASAGSPAMSY